MATPTGSSPLGFMPIADSPSPPTSLPPNNPEGGTPGTPDFPSAQGGPKNDDIEDDEEEEVPSPPPRAKAKPLPEKENKFASTLRRLSTVRKRNKHKKKYANHGHRDNGASNGDSGIEGVTTPSSIHEVRPSSTTSRESDAEALTSGYFRYVPTTNY